jgi:hypothetical protein
MVGLTFQNEVAFLFYPPDARFHHQVGLDTLVNGILQAKIGTTVKLYDLEQLKQEMPFNINPRHVQIA